ncbi:SWPV2-ORF030 [Shearwaterpox virus]|uniref:SWPV2-ORF030 n=1 Tax=Shearwaterpox virus TaxID=1974596 RepID=A0A1V0QFZ4_CNPV|nr:SWPV2-ORF030 [Shearwaterpox virus]QRM15664.1 ankyrin repeat protein [Penguinpox virus 2]QRM15994.1 ankyrin repeat protein [Albatrosspox virus]
MSDNDCKSDSYIYMNIKQGNIDALKSILDRQDVNFEICTSLLSKGKISRHPLVYAIRLAGGKLKLFNDISSTRFRKMMCKLPKNRLDNTDIYCEVVKLLIQYGAKIERVCNSYVVYNTYGKNINETCNYTRTMMGYSYFSNIPLCNILWKETNDKSRYHLRSITIKCAIHSWNVKLLKYFIDNNMLVDTDTHLSDYFLEAIRSNNYYIVKLFLDNGIDLNTPICDQYHSVIYHSTLQQNFKITKMLLEYGANPNIGNTYHILGNVIMSKRHSTELFNILLEYGINIVYKEELLIKAVCKRNFDIIIHLLRLGMTNVSISTLCMIIFELNDIHIVKKLLKVIPDINKPCEMCKMYPIHAAASIMSQRILKLFLKMGVNINVVNRYGKTPLHISALYSKVRNIRKLLRKGADINAIDDDGITPLMCAVKGNKLTNVKFLLENGADVNIKDISYNTALIYAIKNGHVGNVRLLLDYGADINSVQQYEDPFQEYGTPLTLSYCYNYRITCDIITYLYFLSINYPNQYKEFDHNTKSINNYSSTINIKKKIEYEINIMKNMLIGYIDGKAISLLDTLYISKLDTIYRLVKNIKISKLKNMKMFIFLLKKHIKYMEKRNRLIEVSIKTINTVLHDDNSRWWILSPEIHYTILSYLDNNDLKRITC